MAWAPVAAMPVLCAVLAAALVFLPATGNQWSNYTWLALAVTGLWAAVEVFAARRKWPAAVRRSLPLLAVAAAFLMLPHLWNSLWFEIRRVAGFEPASRIVDTVLELAPLYRAGTRPGWRSVVENLGTVWIAAVPALVWCTVQAVRQSRPALRLFTLWSAVVLVATVLQVRMAIYFVPVAAVLAGAASAWVVDALVRRGGTEVPRRLKSAPRGAGFILRRASARLCYYANFRKQVLGAVCLIILAVNLPWDLEGMSANHGLSTDWQMTLHWLREHSTEPVPLPGWPGYYAHGATVHTAWGVAVWWDHGYAVEQIAHRIPMSNGTQSGAADMAAFYTETVPESAIDWLRQNGGRYVIVDPEAPLFVAANRSRFPAQLHILDRNMTNYVQVLVQRTSKGAQPLPVYLPTYYQTMAARLYLGDGQAVAGDGPWIFETTPTTTKDGKPIELIVSGHHYANEAEAGQYLASHPGARLTYGCIDPGRSCVPLTAVKGLTLAYTSAPGAISTERAVRAVKIFEVSPPD